jgi:hypothetical protein
MILEIERGSTRSHSVENSLWKRLRTRRNTDCRMNNNTCERSRHSNWATDWTVRGSNCGRSKRFYPSPKRPDRLWSPSSLIFNGYRGSYPGVKRPGREVKSSPLFSAKVKSEWRYTYTATICLYSVDRENFTFYQSQQQVCCLLHFSFSRWGLVTIRLSSLTWRRVVWYKGSKCL